MYQPPHARIHWYSALLSSATHFILSLDSDKLRTWQHAMCRPEHICDHSSPWPPAQLSSYLTLSDCCSFPALSFSTRQLYNSLCLQKYFMIDEKSFKSLQLIEEMRNLFLIISASASQHVWQWILIEDSETSLCNNIYSTEETTCCMWSWVSRCWIQFPVIKYINPVWSSCSLLNVCSCLQSYLIREFYNRSGNNRCGVLIDNILLSDKNSWTLVTWLCFTCAKLSSL